MPFPRPVLYTRMKTLFRTFLVHIFLKYQLSKKPRSRTGGYLYITYLCIFYAKKRCFKLYFLKKLHYINILIFRIVKLKDGL